MLRHDNDVRTRVIWTTPGQPDPLDPLDPPGPPVRPVRPVRSGLPAIAHFYQGETTRIGILKSDENPYLAHGDDTGDSSGPIRYERLRRH
jgi:hypothetical protein